MRFAEKVVCVTGAARGIGRAVALLFAREGATVVAIDMDGQGLSNLVGEIKALGQAAVAEQADVSDIPQVDALVNRVVTRFGRIDVLVNNAGIIRRGAFVDHSRAEWDHVLKVNLGGTYNCIKAVVPHMINQRGGKIVNVTSVAGKIGDITAAASYGTSKGAVNALTKSLARDLAPHAINVNAVAPHAIETEMSREWSEDKRTAVIQSIPLKRLGQPEEVAEAVAFLSSRAADFITGCVLDVNGGYLMA